MHIDYISSAILVFHILPLLAIKVKMSVQFSCLIELLRLLKKVEVNTCVLCEVSVNLFALLIFTVLFKG
jgi:hypothetical protein